MWAALVLRDGKHVLIIDVEGADGAVHGADKAFELRSAVLIANIADIIMYHVQESAVERYDNAGIPMLERIFKARRHCKPAIVCGEL